MSAEEVAEKLTGEGHPISGRSVLEWAKGKNGARVLVTPGAVAPKAEPSRPVAELPPPPKVTAEPPPPGLSPQARRLWYVEREIRACSDAIAQAHAKGDAARTGSLQEQLRKWLERLAELSPPAPADPHEEERRWRAAADSCVAKIKAGIRARAA
jgi:hypothetical protein